MHAAFRMQQVHTSALLRIQSMLTVLDLACGPHESEPEPKRRLAQVFHFYRVASAAEYQGFVEVRSHAAIEATLVG